MVVRLMPGVLDDVGSLSSLGQASWPILLRGAVAVGLSPWRNQMIGRAGTEALVLRIAHTTRRASAIGGATEKPDLFLRQWPIAVTLLLSLAGSALTGVRLTSHLGRLVSDWDAMYIASVSRPLLRIYICVSDVLVTC